MRMGIDVMANENAEYTKTVINKAADIIENMAATKQDWTAAIALKEADREFRNQNGHGEINFNLTALINSINRHFAAANEERSKQPKPPLESWPRVATQRKPSQRSGKQPPRSQERSTDGPSEPNRRCSK